VHLSGRLAPALAALVVATPGPGGGPGGRGPAAGQAAPAPEAAWTALEPGVELGVFPGPGSAPGDGKIWILRLDPWKLEHWDEYIAGCNFSIPTTLDDPKVIDDLLIFKNSSDEEYEESMKVIVDILES
jgi:hypothetical protein